MLYLRQLATAALICLLMTSHFIFAQDTETCENTLPPRLSIGERARLGDDGEPSRIRSEPSLSGEFIENLYPGEEVLITDGPVCADGYNWWQIQRLIDTAPIGWTVEGTNEDYWLEPTNFGGYYLAYLSESDSQNQLHIHEMHTGNDSIVWSGTAKGFEWMPDGERLIISAEKMLILNPATNWSQELWTDGYDMEVSSDAEWIYYLDDSDFLWRIHPDGTNAAQIVMDSTGEAVQTSNFELSPSNERLAFGIVIPDPTQPFAVLAQVGTVMGVGGTRPREFDGSQDRWDSGFTWSADSRYVAATRWDDRQDVIVWFIDDRDANMGASFPGSEPDWSADLNRIAYLCPFEGETSICTINPDGTERDTLLPADSAYARPLWSPDGRYIAYLKKTDPFNPIFDLWVLDMETSGTRQISNDIRIQHATNPSAYFGWSPASRPPLAEISAPAPSATATEAPIALPPSPTASLVCELSWSIGPTDAACPQAAALTTDAAYQGFEHGFMIWRADLRQIWAFTEEGGSIHDDSWDGSPLAFNETAPNGLIRPDRGFGNIWLNIAGLRERIGWATTGEIPYTMTVQAGVTNNRGRIMRFSLPDSRIVETFLLSYEEGAYFGDWFIHD